MLLPRLRHSLSRSASLYASVGSGILTLAVAVLVLSYAFLQVEQALKLAHAQARTDAHALVKDVQTLFTRLNGDANLGCDARSMVLMRSALAQSRHVQSIGIKSAQGDGGQSGLLCDTITGLEGNLFAGSAIQGGSAHHTLRFDDLTLLVDAHKWGVVQSGAAASVPFVGDIRVRTVALGFYHQGRWYRIIEGREPRSHWRHSIEHRVGEPYVLRTQWKPFGVDDPAHFAQWWRAYLSFFALVLALAVFAYMVRRVLFVSLLRWSEERYRLVGLLGRLHICMLYQPIVDMRSGQVVGCEALLRVRKSSRSVGDDPVMTSAEGAPAQIGALDGPAEILGAVHAHGLERTLDDLVLETVIDDVTQHLAPYLEQLGKEAAGESGVCADRGFHVAVNLFPVSFKAERLHARIVQRLKQRGLGSLPANLRLGLEIVERDVDRAISEDVRGLRERGYSISVDDFGTGYSNLERLASTAPCYLKIDQSFVAKLSGSSNPSMIPGIMMLAQSMGSRVIAEGVETEVQRQALLGIGVHFAQGYLFSRPVTMAKMVDMLSGQATLAPPAVNPGTSSETVDANLVPV